MSVVLVLGCGFIARNVIHFLVQQTSVEEIVFGAHWKPQTAYFSEEHKKAIEDA